MTEHSARPLVVAPTKRELGGLRPGASKAIDAAVVGIGHAAGPALQRLMVQRWPAIVLSLGFGGGLEPMAGTADIVLCTSVHTVDGRYIDLETEALALVLRQAGIEPALDTLLTVNHPLLRRSDKWQARADSGAAVVDMEGFALAEVARDASVPFLAVRVILDEFHEEVPRFVGTIVEDGGNGEWSHSIAALARNPLLFRSMLRLAGQARAARSAMRKIVNATVPTLMQVPPATA